jgi:hypothetical protein
MDRASRLFRQLLLTCRYPAGDPRLRCAVTVLGRATMCTFTNAFGVKRDEPCIAVEDGRQ